MPRDGTLTFKPDHPHEIDWNSPWARGLLYYVLPDTAGGRLEYVTGQVMGTRNTISDTFTKYGRNATFDRTVSSNAGNGMYFNGKFFRQRMEAARAAAGSNCAPFTFWWLWRPTTLATLPQVPWCYPWREDNTWNTPFVSVHCFSDAVDTSKLNFGITGSTSAFDNKASATGFLVANEWHDYAIRRQGGSTSNQVQFVKDGLQHSTATLNAPADGPYFNIDAQFGIGNRGGPNVNYNQDGATGQIPVACAWDHYKSDAELRQFRVNPYVLLKPQIIAPVLAASTRPFTFFYSVFSASGVNSLGGAIGSEVTDATANNLWDNVSGAESAAGDTEYRCIYVKNTSGATQTGVNVVRETDPVGSDITMALGSSGKNGTEQTVANENTAPTGVTFSAGPLSIGTMLANEHYAVWLKRVVPAAASAQAGDFLDLQISYDE